MCIYIYHSFKTWSGGRPGFRVLTGSPGRPGRFFFLKKSKRHRFSKQNKKNKSQRVCNRVAGSTCRVSRVHTGFFLPLFFLQPGLVLAPGRPAGPGRVSKL